MVEPISLRRQSQNRLLTDSLSTIAAAAGSAGLAGLGPGFAEHTAVVVAVAGGGGGGGESSSNRNQGLCSRYPLGRCPFRGEDIYLEGSSQAPKTILPRDDR
ncbi:hypothetical protein B296_00018099 [Ensete ventricosum]|uniref:Uncharacterized protein n=1 Tax=Ensete ventricosum TaxID=4639 RepID=A0A427B1P5_ENSVE|nr:hypothetical protein B296_00018099 [Ensete ventricosum]